MYSWYDSMDIFNAVSGLLKNPKTMIPNSWFHGQLDTNKTTKSNYTSTINKDPQNHKPAHSSKAGSHDGPSADSMFWSSSTSFILETLLKYAEYSSQEANAALRAYEEFVVGSLGPNPKPGNSPGWRSFMTDDFTPIEFSWSWGTATKPFSPKVRFSVEPICELSGSDSDPWNMTATLSLMERLENELPSLDTSIYNSLMHKLKSTVAESPPYQASAQSASPSSVFLAFELVNQEPMIKTYMLPFRCLGTSERSCGALTTEFLRPFTLEQNWESLSNLLQFLDNKGSENDIEPFMIAFDCVPLQQTRMKIYVRSTNTSFNAIARTMSLLQDQNAISGALDDLRDLYKSVFSLESSWDLDKPLEQRSHETSGILYYLEVRPGSNHVTLKVYLPIKHYAKNDLKAVEGFTSYLRRKRGCDDKMIDNYLSALEELCTHRKLQDGKGLQTYISCAIKNGQLDITSYINPEIYHQSRYV